MNELLLAIYDYFHTPIESDALRQEVADCHSALSDVLTKENRKVLLRLIDAKDHITETQRIDSFIRGFQIAWQLSTELSVYEKANPIATDPLAHMGFKLSGATPKGDEES